MAYVIKTYATPIISQQAQPYDLPERGPRVRGPNRGHKPRIVVGWNHQDDTPEALQHGRIWCWVGGGKFQVYDQAYNRSEKPGEVRFCGPGNFTMVRMFHPWFGRYGGRVVPQDMDSADKEWCRNRYFEAMANYAELDGPQSDEDIIVDSSDDDDNDIEHASKAKQKQVRKSKKQAHVRRSYTSPISNESSDDDSDQDSDESDDESSSDDGEDDDDTSMNNNPRAGMSKIHNTSATNGLMLKGSIDNCSSRQVSSISVQPQDGSLSQPNVIIKSEPVDDDMPTTRNSSNSPEQVQNEAILMSTLQGFHNNADIVSPLPPRTEGARPVTNEQAGNDGPLFFRDPDGMSIDEDATAASIHGARDSVKVESQDRDIEMLEYAGPSAMP